MRSRSDEFKDLCLRSEALENALRENPKLITEQDENGMTLLHHAAKIDRKDNATQILNVLFNDPGIDFSIKDNKNNTPVHAAAFSLDNRVTCEYVFPIFVKEAAKHGFYFSTLGENGFSVLHIAAIKSHYKPNDIYNQGTNTNNVESVLKNVPNPGLDVLSDYGSTALHFAICCLHFEEAKSLLSAGASPMKCGSPELNPIASVERLLEHAKSTLPPTSSYAYKEMQGMIDSLDELKQIILSTVEVKSYVEICKAARIIAQGSRSPGSLFSNMSDEVMVKIAGHARHSGGQTQKEAEDVAYKKLGKPK